MHHRDEATLPGFVLPSLLPPSGDRVDLDPNGYKIVSVRLREAEFEVFAEQVQLLGLSSNMALRIAARRIGGFLEVDRETRILLEEIVRRIGGVAKGVSRLNAAYASSGRVQLQALTAERRAFGEQSAELEALLRSILNVSKRRIDGRRLLQTAATP